VCLPAGAERLSEGLGEVSRRTPATVSLGTGLGGGKRGYGANTFGSFGGRVTGLTLCPLGVHKSLGGRRKAATYFIIRLGS